MLFLTSKTKTRALLPLIGSENAFKEVLKKVPPKALPVAVLDMSVGEWLAAVNDKEYAMKYLEEEYAVVAFGYLRQFLKEMADLSAFIEGLAVSQTPDEKRAAEGVKWPNFGQRVLIDCVKFFGLHSFAEAEDVKVGDWVTMYMDAAAASQYQKNIMQAMTNNKSKAK